MKASHKKEQDRCSQGKMRASSSTKWTRFVVIRLWAILVIISLVSNIRRMVSLLVVNTSILEQEHQVDDFHAGRNLQQEETNSNWEYVYMPVAPTMNATSPVSIQRTSSANDGSVSISTLIPALPGDITKHMKAIVRSLKAQTVPADEILIVVSDVQTEVNTASSQPEARNATDWCAATQKNLVDLYGSFESSSSSKLKLVCVGELMSARQARSLAARFASGHILSFLDLNNNQEAAAQSEPNYSRDVWGMLPE